MLDRRSFLMLAAAPAASLAAQTPAPAAGPPSAAALFTDPDFGFTAQIALGGSYYRAGDPGRLLAVLSRIKPGDFESALDGVSRRGRRSSRPRRAGQRKGHKVSAREAYLWAAGNFCSALRVGDGAKEPERMLPCWKEQAACWSAAAALLDPPAERIEIPYEGTKLSSWFLRVDNSRRRRPLVILNNGADGLENRMLALGGTGALDRGYNCLIFNGPGQGDSLCARKLCFRPDWEKVITPVVDAMLQHPEVDPKRMALIGVSQGGYWVPRALAFEHRIAAGVADPGVWDVSEPSMRNFPQVLRDMSWE